MKTILAFVGGGDRDLVILQTALGAALPLGAHLDALHVHVPATEAARYSRTEFASGAALRGALNQLQTKSQTCSELAAENVRTFCTSAGIDMCSEPARGSNVSVSFREEKTNSLERLTFHARHSDLVVMGRAKQTQGLAPETLEHLMLHCGRPILVAASAAPQRLTGTVMVCWKESAYSARALTAATPLVSKASRVVFASVAEANDGEADALEDLARQFAWNGVTPEVRLIPASGRHVAPALSAAADECSADLVVMGAYGQSRTHEWIFGSCTEAFLNDSDRPILLMH